MLMFILCKNPFLKTSTFKKLSWIYITGNSMYIKIFCWRFFGKKLLRFPALLIQPRCWILPCHCGGLCPPCALTTLDSLLVLLLLLPDMGTLSHSSDIQKNNFPWGSSAKSQFTPQAFAHRLFWTIILLQEHSMFLQIWLNLVKRCYRLRGAKRANTHIHAAWQHEPSKKKRHMSFVCSFPVIFLHCVLNKRNSFSWGSLVQICEIPLV